MSAYARYPLVLVWTVLMVAGCGDSTAPDDKAQHAEPAAIARIRPAQDVVSGAHVPTLDPAKMNDAEIRKTLGADRFCAFQYASFSEPVLAISTPPSGPAAGVIKLNGDLVKLESPAPSDEGRPGGKLQLSAGPVRMTITPDPSDIAGSDRVSDMAEASVTFGIDERLQAGYRGYLSCTATGDAG